MELEQQLEQLSKQQERSGATASEVQKQLSELTHECEQLAQERVSLHYYGVPWLVRGCTSRTLVQNQSCPRMICALVQC